MLLVILQAICMQETIRIFTCGVGKRGRDEARRQERREGRREEGRKEGKVIAKLPSATKKSETR